MRWLWGRRKRQDPIPPVHTAPPRVRRADPVPDTVHVQRTLTIRECETLSRYIDSAQERLEAATADLAGNPERTLDAWARDVLPAIERVARSANWVNSSAPRGKQLPYRYLRRIQVKFLAPDTAESVRIALFAAYQEALGTLRRDTERFRAMLVSENNEVREETG